jgi:hypothetical protein
LRNLLTLHEAHIMVACIIPADLRKSAKIFLDITSSENPEIVGVLVLPDPSCGQLLW